MTKSYSQARAQLASLCDQVAETRVPVIIKRRNAPAVALIAADELESIMETAHLLRSPANASRLLTALGRSLTEAMKPTDIKEMKATLGLQPHEG